MDRLLLKQLDNIKKKEAKILNKPENTLIKQKVAPLAQKVEDKIPTKLKGVLETAFYKGFQLVFEKGNRVIEKTYNKEKLQLQYDINNYAIDRKLNRKHIKNMDKASNQSNLSNSVLSLAEGSVLGMLGIGLPDIPIFIGMIMKTIYEIALSYGYNYESDEEKVYILLLICAAMTKKELQKDYDNRVEFLGEVIDHNHKVEVVLEQQMKITSEVLSEALLTAKFVQGLPIIGAVGGLINHTIIKKIGKYAALKYKKRYLLKKKNQK